MKSQWIVLLLVAGIATLVHGCHKRQRFRFEHPTEWYEYSFKRGGPAIAGFTYRFDDESVIVRMFGASLLEGRIVEDDGYTAKILRKDQKGYEIVTRTGSRGSLRFDGDDLILMWENAEASEPERRLTSVRPDFEALRARWEADNGVSVEEFLRD